MVNDRSTYLDGSSFEETEDYGVFVYRGAEVPVCTKDGLRHLCKDGDRLRLDGDENDWLEIVEVIPAFLN